MKDIALRASGLGKCFKIYSNPWHRAIEWGSLGKRSFHQPFWALTDISFVLKRGEFLGIIGLNGAGKSTLLKILSGVLQQTTGSYQINGKVLSMLDLWADFNPYLSGRRNIIRGADLFGFPEGYVHDRLEQIREFAELGAFFDRPVRLYSQGMVMRLAFSMFAFLECDVLILDEILAVGDIFFRQKCHARLEELIGQGTAVILVTHQIDALQHYCNQIVLLHRGGVLYQGKPREAIHQFYRLRISETPVPKRRLPQCQDRNDKAGEHGDILWPADDVLTSVPADSQDGVAQVTRLALCTSDNEPGTHFAQGERVHFFVEFHVGQNIGVPIARITIYNIFNVMVHGKDTFQHELAIPQQVYSGQWLRLHQSMTLNLEPGEYTFRVLLAAMSPDDYNRVDNIPDDDVPAKYEVLCNMRQAGFFVLTPRKGKGMKGLHWGICDLPGDCQLEVVEG
ncbi:MAG: ABC transporter ATP-binding protein [Thermodesulfobacteriota bacterium]|nr:ABC transporter ATP-binding protein [Thermodesulfobacteriota bacterium]